LSKCLFCGEKMPVGTGKMLVLKSNKVMYFCSGKCEKNWKMKRDPKRIKWSESYKKGKTS